MIFLAPRKSVLSLAVLAVLSGCAAYDDAVENQKTVYKTAKQRSAGLEVPPDLTAQRPDDQFLLPGDSPNAPVTASGYYGGQAKNQRVVVGSVPVMVTSDKIELKRVGNNRSLVIDMPADQLWPELRRFWPSVGLELEKDQPEIGLMETVWAENRANVPMDGLRKYIGRVFDGLYSSNMRDKYRLRVEKLADNKTEVFITHSGMEENFIDKDQTRLQWMPRPRDPELEAEMLSLLAAKLTGEEQKAIQAGRDTGKSLVMLEKTASGTTMVVAEAFPQAWRRVGFALDRSGFIVEDRDRENGLYYVRYSPDSTSNKKPKGFFGRLFFGGNDTELESNEKYQVTVVSSADNQVKVNVRDGKGNAAKPELTTEAMNLISAKMQ